MAKEQELAEIAVKKFRGMTEAIGADTLRDIALAGPELQVSDPVHAPHCAPRSFMHFWGGYYLTLCSPR